MFGECQPNVEHVIGGDRPAQVIDRLVANIDYRRRFGFGSDGHRNDPNVLAVRAGDLDQRLVVVMRHHLELAIGQALAALGAVVPTRLPSKDI